MTDPTRHMRPEEIMAVAGHVGHRRRERPRPQREPVERYVRILVVECYLLGLRPLLNVCDRAVYVAIHEADLVVLQLPGARSGRIVLDRYWARGGGDIQSHEEIDGRELAFLRRHALVVAL